MLVNPALSFTLTFGCCSFFEVVDLREQMSVATDVFAVDEPDSPPDEVCFFY